MKLRPELELEHRTVIHSARLITDGTLTEDAWVSFSLGVVAEVGIGDTWQENLIESDTVIDAGGDYLTPGFVDMHCHGAAGVAFEDPEADDEALERALAFHRAHGSTSVALSLVSAPIDQLADRATELAEFASTHPEVLGIHYEGPFLARSHCGAHNPEFLIEPQTEHIDLLVASADLYAAQVTIAPELPGAMQAIERFYGMGVRVAVGHTGCDYETAREAFDRGVSILTHAFNGMTGMHHRAPGPVLAAVDSGATLEAIVDGAHLAEPTVRLLQHFVGAGVDPTPDTVSYSPAAAGYGTRVALVTDAMAATGCADGEYSLGGSRVRVTDGVARLSGKSSIAGSTLTMDQAVRGAVAAGWALPDAIAAATSVPASALGRFDLGTLCEGALARAVLLDDELHVRDVIVCG